MKKSLKDLLFRVLQKIFAVRMRICYLHSFRVFRSFFSYTPQEQMIHTAINFVTFLKIPGDYLEFGSYEGHSAATAYHYGKLVGNAGMRLYCFDSFDGLPEPVGIDKHAEAILKKGDLRCDLTTFKKNIKRWGIDMDAIKIVPGFYDAVLNTETAKRLKIEKAAVIFIDCDFYSSTVRALDFIIGFIQDGTVIVFDDWFLFKGKPEYGEQKAFTEWMARNQHVSAVEYKKFGWHGNSFIIHIN